MEIERLIEFACVATGSDPASALSKSRKKSNLFARHILAYFLYKYKHMTYYAIRDLLHRESHATIINGINKMEQVLNYQLQPYTGWYLNFLAKIELNGSVQNGKITITRAHQKGVIESGKMTINNTVYATKNLTVDDMYDIFNSHLNTTKI